MKARMAGTESIHAMIPDKDSGRLEGPGIRFLISPGFFDGLISKKIMISLRYRSLKTNQASTEFGTDESVFAGIKVFKKPGNGKSK